MTTQVSCCIFHNFWVPKRSLGWVGLVPKPKCINHSLEFRHIAITSACLSRALDYLYDHVGVIVLLHVIETHKPWHVITPIHRAGPLPKVRISVTGDRRQRRCVKNFNEQWAQRGGGGGTTCVNRDADATIHQICWLSSDRRKQPCSHSKSPARAM